MPSDDTVVSPAELRDSVFQTIKQCPLWALSDWLRFVPALEIQGAPVVGEWPNGKGEIAYGEVLGAYVVAPSLSRVVAAGPAFRAETTAEIRCPHNKDSVIAYLNVGVFVDTHQDVCCMVAWCRQHPRAPGFWVQMSPMFERWWDWSDQKAIGLRLSVVPPSGLWILPSPWRTRHAFKWEKCPCETCQTQEVLRTMLGDPLAYERFQHRWAEVAEFGRLHEYRLVYTTAREKCTDPRCPLATHTIFVIQAFHLDRVIFVRKAQGKGAALDAVEWVHARLAACSAASLAVTESGVGACQPAE